MRISIAILLPAALLIGAPQPTAPPLVQPSDVLEHIKDSISWYRQVNADEQTQALASDVLLRDSTHAAALKAVQLAFTFGQAAANYLDASSSSPQATTGSSNLRQSAARAAARVNGLQAQLKSIESSMQTARGTALETLRAQHSTIQAQLGLATQVRDTINTLAAFTPSGGASGLGPQVEELERQVPEAAPDTGHGAAAAHPATSASAPAAAASSPSGIFGLSAALLSLSHNHSQLRQLKKNTDALTQSLARLRAPLITEVRSVVARSESLGAASGSEDAQQLAADQQEIESLTGRFRDLSALLVPLGEQNIVLGTVRGNLDQAMGGIADQTSDDARDLLLRLAVLAVAVGSVMLLSALWRRLAFRYIREPRRRTQFLMLRRVLVAILVTIIIILNFVTAFGSLATYAGLLTAGIAVALQNVILSVVAYFFLIGRYGVRRGDRITVSGVTGTVIEIGLVRLFMVELAGTSGDFYPTGRIVVYSNSVLFQPAALFKHLSATNYVWHTVRLVLTPESDFQLAESRIGKAVENVYQTYRDGIEQQHANFERATDTHIAQPRPEVKLRYTDQGIEVLVLYPAEPQQAPVADNQMMRAIEEAVAQEPKLTLASAGTPRVVANAA